MVVVNLYAGFHKKLNSTLRPDEHIEVQEVTGYLNEPCSILHPSLRLQDFPAVGQPYFYQYAYIPTFGRYYFVEDWTYQNGLWEVSLTVDVLATYRTSIGENNLYVLRTDSTTDFNGAVTDTMYPATTNFDIDQVAVQNPFVESVSQGVYIVGVINKNSVGAVGAITYYAMSSSEFGNLKNVLFSDTNLDIMGILSGGQLNIDDMSAELFRTLYNPYQYIASCVWFPIPKEDIPGLQVTGIDLGWWSYGTLSGKKLSSQTATFTETAIEVPVHPQAATRGKYLNYAPYTRLTMYGKFGSLPIDTAYLEIGSYLHNIYTVDLITGETIVEIFVSETQSGTGRKPVIKSTFLLGTPIQIAQVGVDFMGTAANLISTGGDALSGMAMTGSIAGAIAGGASGIYNTLCSAMPQLMTGSANGSFALTAISTVLIAHHYSIVDEDISHRGRPLCANRVINTLSGFVLCGEGDIDLNALDNERKMVREFLTTGFFWE